ncbi:unnamed protein product [Mytilus coruscus]|uniref:Uncharacterized protein n=1 Tax=Mytilus coruscus TaxID=42192 RepID=A0A6J7ZZZ7_MYTCO|nr:unnamed protein product [Mytilus coruscus]
MEHEISLADKMLHEWHSHCVHTVHQEGAKQSILCNLQPNETLIIMDWAMKFIPFLHREKQTEFFGKKGISWHFTCAVLKELDELKLHCYIHILEDGIQGWYSVACILNNTLDTMKTSFPHIIKAFIKSDNAGCYHNGHLLAYIQSRNQISKEPSIKIMQYNFSEAQSGKDLCDSKTSHSKLHMLRFADEGNDILGPCDMKTALDCYGGLRGTYSSVISVSFKQETLAKKAVKIPGISYMNNFEFKEDGIYAKRAYNVGTGKFLKNADLNIAELNELKHFQGDDMRAQIQSREHFERNVPHRIVERLQLQRLLLDTRLVRKRICDMELVRLRTNCTNISCCGQVNQFNEKSTDLHKSDVCEIEAFTDASDVGYDGYEVPIDGCLCSKLVCDS